MTRCKRPAARTESRHPRRAWTEALEQRVMLAQWERPDFGGNPYVNIAAIDPAGDITLSRSGNDLFNGPNVAGDIPCFVQASASAITATGTGWSADPIRPYEDLEYKWNFGDLDQNQIPRREAIYNPARGEEVNANTDQTGPEAAYVYRFPGQYQITLTVRGRTSGGSFVTRTFDEWVKVGDWTSPNAKVYYDPVGGSATGLGTQQSPKKFLPDSIPDNQWAFIKRHPTTDPIDSRPNPITMGTHTRISAYGSGRAPVIRMTGAGQHVMNISNDGNIVVSDVRLESVNNSQVVKANATGSNGNIYFDNVEMKSLGDGGRDVAVFEGTHHLTRNGFWNTNISNSGAGRHGIYGIAHQWGFVVGGEISGKGIVSDRDHHIYPQVRDHSLYRWIQFGTGVNRSYNINTNAPDQSFNGNAFFRAKYHLVADNFMTGTPHAIDASNGGGNPRGANDPTASRFDEFVIQGNAFKGFTLDALLWYCMEQVTIRDNVAWNNAEWLMALDANHISTTETAEMDSRRYIRPQVYKNLVFHNGRGVFRMANLQKRYLLAGNTATTGGASVTLASADFNEPAGTVVDENRWDAPSTNPLFLRNGDTGDNVDFETWQNSGFDQHGFEGDPGWIDEANGNFLTQTPGSVTGFTLINAATDQVIGPFTNNMVLDVSGGRQYSVRAETNGTVESVAFRLDGAHLRTESSPPYAVAGDSGTDYFPWSVSLGNHTLSATPYLLDNAAGASGKPFSVMFSVTDGTTPGGTVRAAADAYVRDGVHAATNFGQDVEMQVKKVTVADWTRESYLRFDLATVGPAENISTARLRLFGRQKDTLVDNVPVGLYPVSDTVWAESGITWNSRPFAGATALDTETVDGAADAWYTFDVTEYLRQQRATGGVSFALKALNVSEGWVGFNTDEATANKPELLVTYSGPAKLADDAYVRGGASAANNYGSEPGLMVKESITPDNDRQAYLKFDITQFPTVGSARLRLFGYVADGATSGNVAVHGVSDTSWGEGLLTWNNKPAAGAVLATRTIDAAGAANAGWFEWDVTSYVQSARNAGASFVSLTLRSTAQDEVRFVFNSSESASNHPELLIA